MDAPSGPARGGDRGQLALDFLAGMAVFLVTIGFVLGFVPGMFQPFESQTGARMVSTERAGAHLVERLLVEDVGSPGVLNETCTAEFFDGDGNTGNCRFGTDASDLNAAIGIEETEDVNVTIESDGAVVTVAGTGGPVTAAAGATPPSTGEVVTAKRVVSIGEQRRTLFVRVW